MTAFNEGEIGLFVIACEKLSDEHHIKSDSTLINCHICESFMLLTNQQKEFLKNKPPNLI
jgi:hypothetical protein